MYNIEHRIKVSASQSWICFKVSCPNKYKDPEAYSHYLLFMFYPFRSEEQLKAGEPLSYSAKLLEAGLINVVNENRSLVYSTELVAVFFVWKVLC